MKKYITAYNEATKLCTRTEATKNIGIETKLFADRLEVRFLDKSTGEVKINIALCLLDKSTEKLCQNLIDANLAFLVEMQMRFLIERDYKDFMNDGRQSLRLHKVGHNWVFILNLFLITINLDCGNEIGKLATDLKKFFA